MTTDPPPAAPDPRRLIAGRVGPPHGLDGSFRVIAAVPALLGAGAAVEVGGRQRRIDRRFGHERRVLLRLAGDSTREAAEALRGLELLVPRERAPALEPDEWWADDLVGCRVADGDRSVGVVRELIGLPSCEVLVVTRDDSEASDLLVPLVSDAVRTVDVAGQHIDVDLSFLGEA